MRGGTLGSLIGPTEALSFWLAVSRSPFAAVGWQCQAQLGLAGRGSVGGAAEAVTAHAAECWKNM